MKKPYLSKLVNFICNKFVKEIRIIKSEPILLLAFPVSLISFSIIFILQLFVKIRVGFIRSDRLGHFAANTELYLCNRDNRNLDFIDLHYFPRKPCNHEMARIWKRYLIVLPYFLLRPLDLIFRSFNCFFSYRAVEAIGGDRDIDNLLDRTSPHINFTFNEEMRGKEGLARLGIKDNAPYICITVRDSLYLNMIYGEMNVTYHNHRDSNIQDYLLAIETLANRGYYVIRMGAKVREPLNSSHPRVIDYASNGMRTEFMDIYLGAKCFFAISSATGWDAIPLIFRRPIAFVNVAPLGILFTFSSKILAIAKHHISKLDGRELTMREIFSRNVGFCTSNYEFNDKGLELVDNTPEEIRDLVVEMADRLEGVFQSKPEDKKLQSTFRKIFPKNAKDANGIRLHGKIYSRYGSIFLRNNLSWLQ